MAYKQGPSGLFLPTTGKSVMVRFGTLEVWAEDGSVWWSDTLSDKKGSMSPSVAEHNFRKVWQMHGTSDDPGIERDSQERADIRAVAQGLADVIQKAREQSPEEPLKTLPALPMKWVDGKHLVPEE